MDKMALRKNESGNTNLHKLAVFIGQQGIVFGDILFLEKSRTYKWAIRSFNKDFGLPKIIFKQEGRGLKSRRENHSFLDQTTGTIFGSLVNGADPKRVLLSEELI